MRKFKRAFSIIEVIIWVFIFSLWISAIYMLISSTLTMDMYNKNHIVAWNLSREGIELVRNIRDSNYTSFHSWNQLWPHLDYNDSSNYFNAPSYYKIENDFSSSAIFPIKIEDISLWFDEWEDKISTAMQAYRLCLDTKNRYTYDCSTPTNKKTNFYRYIKTDELKYKEWWSTQVINNAFKLTSKVIWLDRWYHEFELNTIITDWKRL